ncbi:unnamed protein product [Adineta ricciae]|uniref:ADP-ribosylation factor-like protein 6 n=1 Tax=Adineta ricciae TaxID=249248 RepID=A0A815HJU1_ADIRI|nr:unnamed protein product [Adineta ricciae]CAF1355051.1 unnamed protein product [Adineta ricciae]
MSSSANNQATAGNTTNKSLSVLITGPYEAGKKTIVHMAKHGKISDISPTIGVEFEKLSINETPLLVWSLGGRSRYRPITMSYYRRMSAFIFVVDSNDHLSIGEARERLHQIVGDDRIEDKPILIFANKQDLPDAMSVDQLRDKLHLDKVDKKVKWHLQPASATQNQGLQEGFEWLIRSIPKQKNQTNPIVETANDAITMKNDFISLFNITKFTADIWRIISSSFTLIGYIFKH